MSPPSQGETVVRKVMKVAPGGPPPPSPRVNSIGQIELLLESAFGLPASSESRILNTPDWVRSEGERYQLSAKIEDRQFSEMQKMPTAQQQKQIALMEQALLRDRLGLKVHFEMKELPVQALVIKGKPALMLSQGHTSHIGVTSSAGQHTLTAEAATMDELVTSPFLRGAGRIVVNQTGLTERYDFTLMWSDELASASESTTAAPTLASALEQQLGLRLRSAREPLYVVVVDHIDRPTDN